jgi:protein-disulfide isomerase
MNRSACLRTGILVLALAGSACDQMNQGAAPPAPAGAAPAAPAAQKGALAAPADLYKVPIGDAPGRGGAEAKVTIVVFSEFQCPFCGRVEPTLEQALRTYGDDVRVVWKHLPLPFHERALPAAYAVEAAAAQGKFWPMHDALFAHQTALGPEELAKYAGELKLDVARFTADLASDTVRARVEADRKLAQTLGVRGTPTLFVNGRRVVGAQPWDRIKVVIDEELARADAKLAAGTSRGRLYAALIEGGLDKEVAPPPDSPSPSCAGGAGACAGAKRAAAPAGADSDTVYKIDLGGAPSRGARDAPITLVVFSDFQCPFCGRIEPTLAGLEQAYPGKLRVVWKNFPLEFHGHARLAAAAALAAHGQGKFWAMHDKLFAHQQELERPSLEAYAGELGLDPGRFKAALDSELATVDADTKLGASLGVTGTPTVFVNGRRVTGAQPIAVFKTLIDEELRKRGG